MLTGCAGGPLGSCCCGTGCVVARVGPTRCAIHPTPSSSPCPVSAQHPWMCQSCFLMECSASASESSATLMAVRRSCLLARMRTGVLDSDSWSSSRKSSSCALV